MTERLFVRSPLAAHSAPAVRKVLSTMPHLTPNLIPPWTKLSPTALLVLADGTIIEGRGLGAYGEAVGELCFHTAMTGYQEIMTDPSYTDQIIVFTFPHIGNVGANGGDMESGRSKTGDKNSRAIYGTRGIVLHADVTLPSNYRAQCSLDQWLKEQNIIGISGVDTRALTINIREKGMMAAVLMHPEGESRKKSTQALQHQAQQWGTMGGRDLVPSVSVQETYIWEEEGSVKERASSTGELFPHVVVLDYGCKENILRLIQSLQCRVTIVPAHFSASDILNLQPQGILLSNGPGDPGETAHYAVPTIQRLLEQRLPIFGICLGHQLMALAAGAKTQKMAQGHHGANHPVKELDSGKVEIVSMNHGFSVDRETLPNHVMETHISLFDHSNCGLSFRDRPAFSVQYHPEGSPGPHDSHHLFQRFKNYMLRELSKGNSANQITF